MEPDEVSQDSPQVEAPAENSQDIAGDSGFSGHPAWKPFEDTLGPIGYRSIEPHLKQMNSAYEAKISAQNKALEPFKQFIDDKVDPQRLFQARTIADEIESNPKGFYDRLSEYLRQTGQLEAAAQMEEAGEQAEADSSEEDPRYSELQAQLATLQGQQEAFLSAQQQELASRQYEAEVAEVSNQLDTEINGLKQAGVDDFTIRKALDAAQLHYFREGAPLALADAVKLVQQDRQTILNQPRPTAPRLPSSSGGTPQNGGLDLSGASRSESQNALAAFLAASRG